MQLPNYGTTLFTGHSSRIQTNGDVGCQARCLHMRIGFGKSTLSSRTEVDGLDETHDPIPPSTQR